MNSSFERFFAEGRTRKIIGRVVRADDLEMLRLHRNTVRHFLEDDAEITAEQQAAWFEQTGGAGLQIVQVDGTTVGLARIGTNGTVGCDALVQRAGGGAAALWWAITVQLLNNKKLDLWAFVDNYRAVRLYDRAGFRWDTRTPVRWMMRDLGDGVRPRAYARMILEP